MKCLVLSFFLLLCGFAVSAQSTITPEQINVTITSATTREELASLANQLNAQGILFRYKPQFGSNRTLTGIAYRLYTSSEQQLAQCDMTDLKIQGASAGFRLLKENGQYSVVCAGNCP
jgi:hypothetical protein